MSWQAFTNPGAGRGGSRRGPLVDKPFVSLRASGAFGFSKVFRDKVIRQTKRATIWLDAETRRLGFRFHNNLDDRNSYAVACDLSDGRSVQAAKLYDDYPWLRAGIGLRLAPEYDKEADLWFVTIPAQEENAA